MNYKLSICIPTYNREKYLIQLLDRILNQLKDIIDEDVEICISDNASTDNTQQTIQQYKQKHTNITYFRWNKNMGFDANILNSVKISNGQYCWLFGSDDAMTNDAIKQILKEIKENHDIYLCNRFECDKELNIKREGIPIFKSKLKSDYFKFGTNKQILYYFNNLNKYTINGLFSYISCIIFKKEQWDSIKFNDLFLNSAYSYTFILLSLLKKNITLKYINKNLIYNRNDNDIFSSNGFINRIKIDFDGYKKLFLTIFADDLKLANFYKKIFRTTFSYPILSGIYESINNLDKPSLLSIVKETHNIYIIKILSIFYHIYRKVIKKFLQKLNIHQKLVKILFK